MLPITFSIVAMCDALGASRMGCARCARMLRVRGYPRCAHCCLVIFGRHFGFARAAHAAQGSKSGPGRQTTEAQRIHREEIGTGHAPLAFLCKCSVPLWFVFPGRFYSPAL